MPKKMFGLHKNDSGAVVGAFEFDDSYDLSQRIRALDIHDGDWIDFRTVAERKPDEADVQLGSSRLAQPPSPTPQQAEAVLDEQPL